MGTQVQISFRANVTITGDTIDEIRRKWESLELFSDKAFNECGAEFVEVVSVENEDFEDLTDKFY